ncbi:MAG TPA: PEP-CTERM sorting domain-containing protein, partial [Lacipirellulaceae bacterium]|nr:PEP-CTERM sorting domain-containing protein [Lacipirellulaceae bacterium]
MKTLTFATLILVSLFAATSHAADVLFSGTIGNTTNFSPAGANLGTQGFWFANFARTGGVNNAPPTENERRQLPAYVTLSFGDTIDSAGGWGGYDTLTLPDGTSGLSGALEMNQPGAPGVAGTREDYLTLTFGAGAPSKLRLGVVIDNTDGLQFSNSQVLVNNVSTGALTNNLTADVKVFDIFNIAPGNTLVVEGISSTASVGHLGGFLLDPLHTIDLEVASNGAVRILPPTTASLDIKGYTVTSASGALNTAGVSGLEATALGNGNPTDGLGWEKLGAGLSTKVGEFNLTGSTLFGPGGITAPQNLGNLYSPGGAHDLQLQFSLANGTIFNGAVNYVTSTAIPGDYNNDGAVNAADYVVWRKTDGTQSGYNTWRTNFGRTSGSGAALGDASSVPEPAGLLVALAGALGMLSHRAGNKRGVSLLLILICAIGLLSPHRSFAAVTLDREYRFGDEPSEGAVLNNQLGSGNGFGLTFDSRGTSGAGDLQDLTPAGGSVTYTNVSSRPQASGSVFGAAFAGGRLQGDFEAGAGGLGYPGATPSPNGNPSVDYSSITTRGIQLWVNPTDTGARQEIINDTYQFGIHINANDTWGMTWGATGAAATAGRVINSTTFVNYGTWSHVHQHSYGLTRGVLYVNGVAVATSAAGNIYQTLPTVAIDRDITVGAQLFTFANLYSGTMDDLELYVAGVSNNTKTNYGTFNLGTDNEYIASRGLTQGDLNDDDIVNDSDVAIFVDNWRRQQLLSGRRTGDINSRMFGDFDYDGFVGILDWDFIRDSHIDGASLNLGALLAESGVPEPASGSLLLMGMLAASFCRRRLRRRISKALVASVFALSIAGGMMAPSAHAANVWNVDFQGDTNSAGLFGQSNTAKNYGPDGNGIWNHFTIPALSANPQVNFATNPSMALVNNDGAASPVTVTLNGMYAGWNGAGNDHPLFGDYVIILGGGTLGFPAPPLNLSISGLTPGVKYGLRVISGNVSI